MNPRTVAEDFVGEALGRSHREDPALPVTGGPAGNARLTAWTGIVLLVLFLIELATLLDVRSLLSWHVFVGVLLIPPALVKTASTTWRFARYYSGSQPYRKAGPPTLLLRVLGPLVVLSTLGVLGSGLTLVLVGPTTARQPISLVGANTLDLVMIHKAAFVLWAGATGIHVLGRLVPAARLTLSTPTKTGRIAGARLRAGVIWLALGAAVLGAVLALSLVGPYKSQPYFFDHGGHSHSKP